MNAKDALQEMLGRKQTGARTDDIETVIGEVLRLVNDDAVINPSMIEAAWNQVESAAKVFRSKIHRDPKPEWSDFVKRRALMIATWINGLR